jgi:hypothetical protein
VIERKYKFALLSRFKKHASEKNPNITINMHVEQWAAQSLIESYTLDTCYEMIEYYCKVSDSPDWKWFANNADKVYKNLTGRREDDRIRSVLREQAKDWLNR